MALEVTKSMQRLILNCFLGVGLLAVAVVAELVSAVHGAAAGIGIDGLLCKPFAYAFFILALLLFVAISAIISSRAQSSCLRGAQAAAGISFGWMCFSFFTIVQPRLSRGGHL